MKTSHPSTRSAYPAWMTQVLGALLFFLLGLLTHSLATGRDEPRAWKELHQEIAAVKDSVLLLAYSTELSDTVRERILEDTGLLRNQSLTDIWKQRRGAVEKLGRRDTVQIGAVLLDALLRYYEQWGDLRGAILLTQSTESKPPLRLLFGSLQEGEELVRFIGRYRGELSLRKVEFLPLPATLGLSADSRAETLRSLSLFLIDAYVDKASVHIDVALSPSFATDTR